MDCTAPRTPAHPLDAVPDAPSLLAQLVVTTGPDAGFRCPLDEPTLVIGRSRRADLSVSDASLSQRHAQIVTESVRDANGDEALVHTVIDLGSTNGTIVNGQRVQRRRLNAGDRLQLGKVELTYDCGLRVINTRALMVASPVAPARNEPPLLPTHLSVPLPAKDGWDTLITALLFVRRHALALGLGAMLGAGAGVASAVVLPPAAEASFELSLVRQAADNPIEARQRENFEFFRQPRDTFVRPALITATLAALGDEEVTAAEVADTKARLSMTPRGDYVWAGSYRADTAEEAVDYLNAHLERFLAREVDAPLRGLAAEIETLSTQLAEADQTLTGLELAKAAWAEEAGGVVPEHAALLQQRMFDLQGERSRAAVRVATAQADLKLARKLLASEDPEREVFVQQARPFAERIAELNSELAEARANGKGAMHPDIVRRQLELAELTQQRDEILARGSMKIAKHKNPAYAQYRAGVEQAKTTLANAKVDSARVHRDLTRAEAAVAALPRRDAEYAQIVRDLTVAADRHTELATKLQASEVRLLLERRQGQARYDLLMPPTAKPSTATKTAVMRGSAGAVVGVLLVLLVAMLGYARRMVTARLPTRL